jgi:hypothetical protein
MTPRILYYDIEWEPATAYVWRMWDENVSPDQLIDAGGLLCFTAHWEGEKDFHFYSKWDDGRQGMAKKLLELFTEADAVITYNGDRYDIPKTFGEILLAGLTPPPMPVSIDLIRTVKKMGFVMNRLAYIGPLLGVGGKVKHQGFNLWKDVMAGKTSAQNKMKKYCIQDVKLLVTLYKKVRPFIRNHPHLGEKKEECGACHSTKVQHRGYYRTKYFKVQRLQCTSCGAWSNGKRTKI